MAQRASKAKAGGGAKQTPEQHETADFTAALEEAKLRALYQFAYGLSHEINNPLANIATRAQTLMVAEQDPERRRKLAVIVQQAFRAHEMIADLMLFANPPEMRREPTDLAKLVDTVLSELKPLAAEKKVRVTRAGARGPITAHVDPVQIAVATKAIVQNSLEAVAEKGLVEVDIASGSIHRIRVKDNGPGIAPAIREHIFDPYFSGREAGRGLGLGLSKAWRIVDLHGGRIEVASSESGGAEFVLLIPAEGD